MCVYMYIYIYIYIYMHDASTHVYRFLVLSFALSRHTGLLMYTYSVVWLQS